MEHASLSFRALERLCRDQAAVASTEPTKRELIKMPKSIVPWRTLLIENPKLLPIKNEKFPHRPPKAAKIVGISVGIHP
jgi:hypothetical protein